MSIFKSKLKELLFTMHKKKKQLEELKINHWLFQLLVPVTYQKQPFLTLVV